MLSLQLYLIFMVKIFYVSNFNFWLIFMVRLRQVKYSTYVVKIFQDEIGVGFFLQKLFFFNFIFYLLIRKESIVFYRLVLVQMERWLAEFYLKEKALSTEECILYLLHLQFRWDIVRHKLLLHIITIYDMTFIIIVI